MPNNNNGSEGNISPSDDMSLAEEMQRTLCGDRQSVAAVIHSIPNPVPATINSNITEIVELNRRIRELQKEVYEERLINERRERDNLIRENARLKSLQQATQIQRFRLNPKYITTHFQRLP